MRIGVVGGGITGLTAAHDLLKSGYKVVVWERSQQLGGLASAIKVGNSYIERFYHHLFKSDVDLVALLEELGLGEHLVWLESQIGYYHGDRIYKFGKPTDLLRFHPLSWLGKAKFGLSILYFQRKSSWEGLDDISVQDWFARHGALEVYEEVWKPLLKLKFGDEYQNVAAAWLWGRIHPRAQSRDRIYENESLGYILGSFDLLFKRLHERILDLGGEVRTGTAVKLIEPLSSGQLRLRSDDGDLRFDKIIVTLHNPTFLKLVPALHMEYKQRLQAIRYQAVICMIFILNSSLGDDIYWLNVNSRELPFGGVIEHTNFVSPTEYDGQHLAYVFNYLSPSDPMARLSKEEIEALYIDGLQKIFPNFNRECVKDTVLSKARFATPIYTLDYPTLMPSHETPIPNLYLANTAQVYPEDRNTSNCARNALALTRLIKSEG